MSLPEHVRIVEVGPRDGLQNETAEFDTATRLELIRRLMACGFERIEAGAFVSPKWVPKMADTEEIMAQFNETEKEKLPVLVPNLRGLESALASGTREVAIFASASEAFSNKNINCTIKQSLERFKVVCKTANEQGIRIRGYVSCVLGCPYQGEVNPVVVADIAERLLHFGCYEISLCDTIGVGTPGAAAELARVVTRSNPAEKFAVHFHDTYGQAIANIYACLQQGIRVVDSSVAGLGGCPYAPGAAGNVATEDVVYLLDGLGIKHGIDFEGLIDTSEFIMNALGKPTVSRVSAAVLGKRARARATS